MKSRGALLSKNKVDRETKDTWPKRKEAAVERAGKRATDEAGKVCVWTVRRHNVGRRRLGRLKQVHG